MTIFLKYSPGQSVIVKDTDQRGKIDACYTTSSSQEKVIEYSVLLEDGTKEDFEEYQLAGE
jgi:hypothetical protein